VGGPGPFGGDKEHILAGRRTASWRREEERKSGQRKGEAGARASPSPRMLQSLLLLFLLKARHLSCFPPPSSLSLPPSPSLARPPQLRPEPQLHAAGGPQEPRGVPVQAPAGFQRQQRPADQPLRPERLDQLQRLIHGESPNPSRGAHRRGWRDWPGNHTLTLRNGQQGAKQKSKAPPSSPPPTLLFLLSQLPLLSSPSNTIQMQLRRSGQSPGPLGISTTNIASLSDRNHMYKDYQAQ
jgi:hypothetical protein